PRRGKLAATGSRCIKRNPSKERPTAPDANQNTRDGASKRHPAIARVSGMHGPRCSVRCLLALRNDQAADHHAGQRGERGLALEALGTSLEIPLPALPYGKAKDLVTHRAEPTQDHRSEPAAQRLSP